MYIQVRKSHRRILFYIWCFPTFLFEIKIRLRYCFMQLKYYGEVLLQINVKNLLQIQNVHTFKIELNNYFICSFETSRDQKFKK